jgi:hypothetical protein
MLIGLSCILEQLQPKLEESDRAEHLDIVVLHPRIRRGEKQPELVLIRVGVSDEVAQDTSGQRTLGIRETFGEDPAQLSRLFCG